MTSSTNPTLTQMLDQPSGKVKTAFKIRKTKKKKKTKSQHSSKMTNYFKIDHKFILCNKLRSGVIIWTNKIAPRCHCGKLKLKTSRTKDNPNRKFWCCGKIEPCRAFIWNDEFILEKKKLKKKCMQ